MMLLRAISLLLAGSAEAGEIRPGEIAAVVCETNPQQSYALYLPTSYRNAEGRRWPILFLLDARGRGAVAAERFREGAEAHGYILASSNNSASDGPLEPNIAAMRAMWDDTHRRFAIDPKRVYAGGFSGGARMACLLAETGRNAIAGVIGCGAGFPVGASLRKDTPFLFFGAVGNTDFNYQEMRELDSSLGSLGIGHRLAVFPGGHQWPPPAVCREAITWMELAAMKRGTRPRYLVFVESLARERLENASALEQGRRLVEAHQRYLEIAEDFEGLLDVSLARGGARRLEASREFRAAEKEEVLRNEAEKRSSKRLTELLAGSLRGEDLILPHQVAFELSVADLRRRASSEKEEERLSAKRLLETLFVQTSFYLPRQYLERKDGRRASLCLEVAVALKPELPGVWYDLACARARSGEKRKAFAALREAIGKGFRDRAHIEKDPDLELLRGEAEYATILANLPANEEALPRRPSR